MSKPLLPKSHIINIVHNTKQRNEELRRADLAASFQYVAVEELTRTIASSIVEPKSLNL